MSRIDVLNTSPSSILASYIINESEAMALPSSAGDWPLFVSYLPDSEQDAGAVYDTTGLKDGRLMAGQTIQHYGIQLKIKSKIYEEGWAKIDNIATSLDQVLNTIVSAGGGNYEIQNITRGAPVLFQGTETKGKRLNIFTVNLLMTVKQIEI